MELFEQVRRDREFEGLSIHALARRHRVHRRTVRQALESPLPPARTRPRGRPAPKLGEWRGLIDSWLEADRQAPRKQRHTAKRIHERLRDEHGVEVSERQVRRYVRERRRALGELVDEVFVPLCSQPGAEAEVDWGEATVVIAGVPTRVFLFLMRACFSGACFVQAHVRETQQAFLEGHVAAFEFFGGVFGLVRYDNLGSAVVKVLRGRRRVESDRFVALRSHYLYESSFTRRGKEGAHEKGGVEGDVGRFRRSYLVPVPQVASLAQLNDRLAAACITDLRRTIRGRPTKVGEALAHEVDVLRALPAEPFDSAEHATPRVDAKSLVTVRQNQYSLPVRLAGLRVTARIGAREVVFCHDGQEVARHERLHGRFATSAQLDHYLELLELKPGALARSLALRQERERGAWPDCFDALWQAIHERVGASEAARQMIDVLMLCRELGPARVQLAVRGALAAGAHRACRRRLGPPRAATRGRAAERAGGAAGGERAPAARRRRVRPAARPGGATVSGFRWEIEASAGPAREGLVDGAAQLLVRVRLFDEGIEDAFTDLRPDDARHLAIELLAAAEDAEQQTRAANFWEPRR